MDIHNYIFTCQDLFKEVEEGDPETFLKVHLKMILRELEKEGRDVQIRFLSDLKKQIKKLG